MAGELMCFFNTCNMRLKKYTTKANRCQQFLHIKFEVLNTDFIYTIYSKENRFIIKIQNA